MLWKIQVLHLISRIDSLKKDVIFFSASWADRANSLNCFLASVSWFSVWTAVDTMLSKYIATIVMTDNVDPRSAGQIKPTPVNIIFFTANLLGITYGIHNHENRTTNGIQYCNRVPEKTLTIIPGGNRRTQVECKVDTVETVDSLPQINDNSQAYKRSLTVTWGSSLLLREQLSGVLFSPGSLFVETSGSRYFFYFQIKLWNGWSKEVNILLNSGLVSNVTCNWCQHTVIMQWMLWLSFFSFWLHSRHILLYSLCCCCVVPQYLCTRLHSQRK